MANESLEIKTEVRKTGKHTSRALRNQLLIPAVVYGDNVENKNVSLAFNDAKHCISSSKSNTIFTLKSDTDKQIDGLKVIRRQFEIHPVTRKPLHVDFYAPNFDKKKKFKVIIEFYGKPKGVQLGGSLIINKRDVELECIPALAPKTLKINLANLDIGQEFKASDVNAGENVSVVSSSDEVLAKVVAHK